MRFKKFTRKLALFGAAFLLFTNSLSVFADEKEERMEANRAMPVQSNQRQNWPMGPTVTAASAILMDLDSGAVLYEKNIHDHHYPASTTKILTTLIASERCSMDETVSFSAEAVFGIPRNSNHVAMDVGDTLSMEQCINAILIRSANEVSYAVAEHIGGTWDGFADIMNERAKELGCVDSHFVNPNGLPDENHYTSAYDLAMIGRAFFSNDMLCRTTKTSQLIIPKEKEDLVEWNQMELIPGRKYEYEYLVGCKTGYTNDARNTLVSCAEKNGLKLICVVMRDENPFHYEDSLALFEYGFSNFEKVNISQAETRYNIENTGSFYSDNDIFGSSKPILSLNQQDCVILPKTLSFEDLTSTISYDTENPEQAALITYSYDSIPLGHASVDLNINKDAGYDFEETEEAELTKVSEEEKEEPETTEEKKTSFVFIDLLKILGWILGIAVGAFVLFLIIRILRDFSFSLPSSPRRRWKKRRRRDGTQYRPSPEMIARRRSQIKDAKRRTRSRRRP